MGFDIKALAFQRNKATLAQKVRKEVLTFKNEKLQKPKRPIIFVSQKIINKSQK